MLLKSLSLVGFKSFADRTRLEFDAGVNVVVGPNGTGKSNILDAIAWVMGTQATRALRTERMEDVIFAGTATRPALSRAEVVLTVDNNDGFLPIDLTEVSMARRLYRDGTSEYELNGTSCRLLDIQELLSDGGVGRHQHVLVGQGEIGSILTARPEEHRTVIEEAAGINKHRSRRDRALRRLEMTEADVARLTDLLDEKRRRMRPLRRQANAAERYGTLQSQLSELRLWLGGEDLRSIEQRRSAAGSERLQLEASVASGQEALAALISDLDTIRAETSEATGLLERATASAARLETVAERLRSLGLISRERGAALADRIRGSDDRRRGLDVERAELVALVAAAIDEERRATELAEEREAEFRDLQREERAIAEQLELTADGVLANLKGDLFALQAAATRDAAEQSSVAARRAVVSERLREEQTEVEELLDEIRSADATAGHAQEAYQSARSRRADVQAMWESDEEHLGESRLGVAAARARAEALEAATTNMVDPQARRHIARTGQVVDMAVARLDVPTELTAAVAAALGIWSDAFIVSNLDALPDVTGAMKQEGLGGFSLLAVDEAESEVPANEVANTWGVEPLHAKLGPGADQAVARALIGDVVLVEGWSAGWKIVTHHSNVRAVTPEGDLITSRGMRLGRANDAPSAALETALVELEIAERELARAESHHVATRRSFDSARTAEREALEHLESLEAQLAGHTEALALVDRSRAEREAELARLEQRMAALDGDVDGRRRRMDELGRRIAELEEGDPGDRAAEADLRRRHQALVGRREELQRLRMEAEGARAAAAERGALAERRTEIIDTMAPRLAESPEDPTRIARLAEVAAWSDRAVDVVRLHLGTLRQRQRDLRERLAQARERLDEASARREGLQRTIGDAKDRLGVLAVELAELEVRNEAVLERLRRDADATPEAALAMDRPDLEDVAEGVEPSTHLASLEARLRRMGPINPLAAVEHGELAAEVELLEGQLSDLDESRRELRKVISALDEEMARLFQGAFDEIARYYEENFALVFPGGRGRLRLTEPERPLETGVEVEAQPHGKKIGRLSLLSGGERSLAALAFLFAVFRARPSPFYVLDEVEAALDDANLRRFLRLVDTLRASAQLVIITHQQQTMEAADMLYGVTMEPAESSKVIAKRMVAVPA